jgi:hypothetical protein
MNMMSLVPAAEEEETGAKDALQVEENMYWQYNSKISFDNNSIGYFYVQKYERAQIT